MKPIFGTIAIKDIAEISFGLYDQPAETGDIQYLQARHFDDSGWLLAPDVYLKASDKTSSHLLQDGDVLFTGKGNRLFSWCYRSSMGQMVASSIFFILRPNQNLIYPEFLATVLNLQDTKESLLHIGKGTNIFSIRKSELGAFEISFPALKQQKLIADISSLHYQEVRLLNQIVIQKKQLFKSVIGKSFYHSNK